ncbi:hypothetical protein C8R45DRAFT_843686, partial [Mycena sanguinolenta]
EKKKYLTKYDHMEVVLHCINNHFKSLGNFMEILVENLPLGASDPRSNFHKWVVCSWLAGCSTFRPAQLVEAIYRNHYSIPCHNSTHVDELQHIFDGYCDPKTFYYARPALSSWATQLISKRCGVEIGKLGYDDPNHPDLHAFVRSATNSRMSEKHLTVTQEDVFQFFMQWSANILQSRAPLAWFLTECMAAMCKNSAPVVCTCHPHPSIQVAALSSFTVTRNRSTNSYFALLIGVYLFATKAHTICCVSYDFPCMTRWCGRH